MSISFEKSTCDKYTIRSKDPHWWAVIMVSEDGFVSIQSDYGDYSHHWSSIGSLTIKEFLSNCCVDYISNKLGGQLPKEFSYIKTIKNIKKDITEKRRHLSISKEIARFYWDQCKNLHVSDKTDFIAALNDLTYYKGEDLCLLDLYDGDIFSVNFVMDDNYQLTAFMREIWPEFIKILKQEL